MLIDDRFTPEMKAEAERLAAELTEGKDVSASQIASIVWAEYIYWRQCEIDHPSAVFAIGPLANIIARIALAEPKEQV